MDPVALGLTVAGLVAKKALEKAGEQAGAAGWGMLGRVSQRLRDWFADRDEPDGVRALELVEAAPDSQRAVEALAAEVTRTAEADPAGARQLEGLVGEIHAAGDARVTTFVNEVRDHARVGRIIQVAGDYHER